ncbi:hypothetical protein [Legionella sainthelensi]|uniref:Uncharacterized protein n=1 Tax=Legionella sainthelensi TaxID=28087 RepID=A0A2H5FK43_9GAMM|nr:hypothetical protein [Legionella sainthelensi]AUH71926.1 hypothetical protein CAB17_07485 [Legionella sainthelensi]
MNNANTPKTRRHKIRVALLKGEIINRRTSAKLELGEFNASLHSDISKLKNNTKYPLPIESQKTLNGTHNYFISVNELKRYYDPEERPKQIKELNQTRLNKQKINARKTLERLKKLKGESID